MNPIIKSTKSNFIKNKKQKRERESNQTSKWPKKTKPLDKGTKQNCSLLGFEVLIKIQDF